MLYEIVDHSGVTLLEIGRFGSDKEAMNAVNKIIAPPGSSFLATRNSVGLRKVHQMKNEKRLSRREIIDRLVEFCRGSTDPSISSLIKQYESSKT